MPTMAATGWALTVFAGPGNHPGLELEQPRTDGAHAAGHLPVGGHGGGSIEKDGLDGGAGVPRLPAAA